MSITTDAQFNKTGRTVMQFLKVGIGARPVAMGEAAIANGNDANSVFWNPAAITVIDNVNVGFGYTQWMGDLNIMSGAVGYNTGFGVLCVNYITFNYGDLQEALTTSTTGKLDTRTGSTFSGSDISLGLAFAHQFTDKLSIGVNAKYLRENLYVYSSSVMAFDVGSYYNTGWKGIRLAMSAQNFSGQARWRNNLGQDIQSFELPLIFRIGTSIDLFGGEDLFLGGDPEQHKLTLNVDAIHTNDYSERLHMGAEYTAFNTVSLRAGYRLNYDEGNLSLGAGFKTRLSGVDMQIDYAYVSYDYFKSPHRISITMAF